MYDKLIRQLRNCAIESAPCNACDMVNDDSCADGLMKQAADAIEKLSVVVRAQKAVLDKFPRWIPVKERLPEEYKDVLCYYEYFRYGDFNCMFRTIDRGYYGDGRWGGEAGQGHKNKVLAWMPLPELPKEET